MQPCAPVLSIKARAFESPIKAEGRPATMVVGFVELLAPFKGGTLVPVPQAYLSLTTTSAGTASVPFLLPGSVPAGLPLCFQVWIADPMASQGWSASNALQGVTSG